MKRYVRSSFGYYDDDWINPDETGWELECDYASIAIPLSVVEVDGTGECDYEELIDNITVRSSVTNTTEFYDEYLREFAVDPIIDYVDKVLEGARSERVGVEGKMLIEISYCVSTNPSDKGYVDPDSYDTTGEFDFSELQIIRHMESEGER